MQLVFILKAFSNTSRRKVSALIAIFDHNFENFLS